MTKETKLKVKKEFYERAKEQAVQCLQATKAEVEGETCPNSWEGVMQMVADVMRHGNGDDKAAAVMAASKWTWANCEIQIHEHVCSVKDMIAHEVEAAQGGTLGEDAPAAEVPAAEVPAKTVTAVAAK